MEDLDNAYIQGNQFIKQVCSEISMMEELLKFYDFLKLRFQSVLGIDGLKG